MPDLEPKWFNGVNLARYGLVTSAVAGIHDSAGMDVARSWVTGRDYPSDLDIRRSLVAVKLHCVLAGDDHDDLLSKLAILRGLTSPSLGFCEFSVDRLDQRTFARSKGFDISVDKIPYLVNVIEWDWQLERYGYWEDLAPHEATITATTGTINNRGDMSAYPTYTCTATGELASGLTFTVSGSIFTYTGALSTGDVLTVYTDLPDVTKTPSGGSAARDFANTDPASAFPVLEVGANALTGKTAGFTLGVSWRNRYE